MGTEQKRESKQGLMQAAKKGAPRILSVDIGGSSVKILASGQTEPRSFTSGRRLTPPEMTKRVLETAKDWEFDVVSIGIPTPVGPHGAQSEPGNLGEGWVGFDFNAAFERPVRVMNDAAMQALGSYEGGKMLFLGLGTGVGSTLISSGVIIPLELGNLWWDRTQTLADVVGKKGLAEGGIDAWTAAVEEVVHKLMASFNVDYVVIGGGNAKKLKNLPAGTRQGHNLTAFRGGFRLWNLEDVSSLWTGVSMLPGSDAADWRIV